MPLLFSLPSNHPISPNVPEGTSLPSRPERQVPAQPVWPKVGLQAHAINSVARLGGLCPLSVASGGAGGSEGAASSTHEDSQR